LSSSPSGGHGFFLCIIFFILGCLWKNGFGSSSGAGGLGVEGGPYEGVGVGVGVGVGGPYEGSGLGGGGGGGPTMKCFFFFLHAHAMGEKTVSSATAR
jgi:hypothetical protein